MKRCKRKLRSRAGETLTETLAALLVAVIALAILAGMIMSSSNLIRNSRSRFDSYYEENNALSSLENTVAGASVTIRDVEGEKDRRLTDAQTKDAIDVRYSTNGKAAAYRLS